MSIQVFIDNNGPSVSIQGSVEARIEPSGEILVLTYQALKGDQGEPGSDANVYEHEDTYDHGDLHEHSNKAVLDFLSVDGDEVAYNGVKISQKVLDSQTIQDLIADVEDSIDAALQNPAHEYLFTTDYAFVTWAAANRPVEYALFESWWTPAGPPPVGG